MTAHPAVVGVDPLPEPWVPGSGPKLWIAGVEAYAPRAAALRELLDDDELKRYRTFRTEAARVRHLVAHVALRRLLGAYLDRDPAAVSFLREPCPGCAAPHGRPALRGQGPHFSLSHAGDLVLLGFADTPVGVDVEALLEPGLESDLRRALHPAESDELSRLPLRARPAALGRCWVRKEAYLKGIGIGLGGNPAACYVGTGEAPADLPGWRLADIPVRQGYTAACAVRTADPRGHAASASA
ncbi:4'-phosphopantetheinyl transferase family protein [Streptomyces sp. NPDC093094]|uniref:4'-phosphopantetheinyl transferase family protein n=1 Tax=Streptomyces sp. NPDC093094 TaxID=3366026 RepID=UPI0037F24F83